MSLSFSQQRIINRTVRLVFKYPLFGELALLNFTQDLLHFQFRLLRHYARTPGNITILGRSTDRIPHIGNATLVDQIHDQFYFVQALEISHLRGVAGFYERLIPGLNEGCKASTEHNLFPEEVRLGFLPKARFDHTGPPAANRTGIGKPHLPGRSTWVLMDREQAGYPAALHILR